MAELLLGQYLIFTRVINVNEDNQYHSYIQEFTQNLPTLDFL